jgi:hypothetical protein
MNDLHLLLGVVALVFANTANAQLAGQYVSKDFLSGHAKFWIEVQQTGRDVSVSFRGDYKNPDSAGPRGTGTGRTDGKRMAEFEFEDSCGNSGSGAVIRLGDRVFVSMKAKHIADFSCLIFYQNDMRLRLVEKD